MADIVDIYMECGNFHEAVKQSGLPVHVAHLKLLKSGCLKIQDKIRYGSKGAKLGGEAEALFQKLVPEAIDANRYFKKNNPVYDFVLKDVTIDVKYSSLFIDKRCSVQRWQIKAKGNQDFICAFLEREKGQELADPIVLLLPMAFIDIERYLYIGRSSAWFKEFQIEAEELQPTLKEYVELRSQGLF